jgi:peptide deformylase
MRNNSLALIDATGIGLRTRCTKVVKFNKSLRTICKEMERIMTASGGVGLASNQVGLDKRIIVVHDGKEVRYIINPVITRSEGSCVMTEGCLSFPGVFRRIRRPEKIEFSYQTEEGRLVVNAKADGIYARCVQHEVDHLNGKTYKDYPEEPKEKQDEKNI